MRLLVLFMVSALSAGQTVAQDDPQRTLFTNCNVFDGVAESLAEGRSPPKVPRSSTATAAPSCPGLWTHTFIWHWCVALTKS
jgi:hypothetical protein